MSDCKDACKGCEHRVVVKMAVVDAEGNEVAEIGGKSPLMSANAATASMYANGAVLLGGWGQAMAGQCDDEPAAVATFVGQQ